MKICLVFLTPSCRSYFICAVRGEDVDHNILGFIMVRENPYLWLRIKAVRLVKEIHQHVQSVLLGGSHLFAHSRPHIPHPLVILKPEILRLELDGVVVLELRRVFENSFVAEVPRKGARDIGEREDDVVSQWFGEDSGKSGQHVVNADGAARVTRVRTAVT